ncbi:MAG: hypothetical protein C0501_21355 [Isosphaera sp.]|nr:hypothetical protein [Isosphaera sp.]
MPALKTTLPCVVHLGFAGNRRLFASEAEEARFKSELECEFAIRLKKLEGELRLGGDRFLCGISQIAVGADTLFSKACEKNEYPHRVFLPQHVNEFLAATGSDGQPDFTPEQAEEARTLLAGDHVIQVRMVAHSADRGVRFQETNFEIARLSDVVVCLLRADAEGGKPGGAYELLDQAKTQGIPALELHVRVAGDKLEMTEHWHNNTEDRLGKLPRVPEVLAGIRVEREAEQRLPTGGQYLDALKGFGSDNARGWKRWFRFAAFVIVSAHVLATVLATAALVGHRHGTDAEGWLVGLLGLEFVLLGVGFVVHHRLRKSEAARVWAVARLLAEVARSVKSLGNRHLQLEYLFHLPMPARFRPVFRTLSTLRLRSTRPPGTERTTAGADHDAWKAARDHYLNDRVRKQIRYYTDQLKGTGRRRWGVKQWLGVAKWAFLACASAAILATATKLAGLAGLWPSVLGPTGEHSHERELALGILGGLAIVLPVLAVGALSLAGAMDCYARVHTYSEMLPFLEQQVTLLTAAKSPHEFERLAFLTESQLLGEVVNWFYRRSFTEVT